MKKSPRLIAFIIVLVVLALVWYGRGISEENKYQSERLARTNAEADRLDDQRRERETAFARYDRINEIITESASEVDYAVKMAKLSTTRYEQEAYLATAARYREIATRAHYAMQIAKADSAEKKALLEIERDFDIARQVNPSVYLPKKR